MLRPLNLILLSAAFVLVAINASSGRKWTDRTGRTVEAEFIAFADGKVQIKRASDGKVFNVPIENLSDADQAFVQAHGRPNTTTSDAIKEFGGDFRTGIFVRIGDGLHGVPIFVDRARPSLIKADDDTVSDKLLNAICGNADDLKSVPGIARQVIDRTRMSKSKGLYIAVFTLKSIPVTTEIKNPTHFIPGVITTLPDVKKKFGEPSELQNWTHRRFKSWIGLDDTVSWWGAVGIAASEDGTITHTLIREKESRAQ